MSNGTEHSETGQPDPWRTPEYVPDGKPSEEWSDHDRALFGQCRQEFSSIMTLPEVQALLRPGDQPEQQLENYQRLLDAKELVERTQSDAYTLRIILHSRPSLEDPLSYFEHWMKDDDGPEWVLEQIKELFGDDSDEGGEPPPEPVEPDFDGGDFAIADLEPTESDLVSS